MAKRNSSGSSSGRRGSSRNSRGENSSSGARKSGGKPFRKSNASSSGRGSSFKKRDSGDFEKKSGNSFAKSDKPFGRRKEGSGQRRSGGRSFNPEKPFRRSDSQSTGRGSSSDKENRSSSFKKKESGDFKKRPFRKSGSDESNSSGERRPRKFNKPFEKREERPPSRGRRSNDSREERSDSRSKSKDRFKKDGQEESSGFFKKSKSRYNPKVSKTLSKEETSAPAQTGKMRLNRYIANSGVCSRREADELIAMGLVSVNGKTITEMGYKVNPGDEVRYENKILKAEKPVYILMNKPKGYLTTTDDPQERNTVMHIIGSAVKERIYPVGRLDRNTTGLLLLTNDGDLADKLMHPSYNVKKIYKAELDRPLTKADFQTILDGVMLEEGRAMVDDLAIVSEDGKTIGVEIHIGWNRVVRRIFESLSYEVVRLDRSVYAGLDKKDLGRGQWRHLTREEIVRLKHYK